MEKGMGHNNNNKNINMKEIFLVAILSFQLKFHEKRWHFTNEVNIKKMKFQEKIWNVVNKVDVKTNLWFFLL